MGHEEPLPLPTGTVTFLLTDVEGSTRTWEANPDQMGPAIARHYELLDTAIGAHGGVRPIEQGEGDSAVAAFAKASDAAAAAVAAQRALSEELGDVFRVRMALHTAEAQLDGSYYRGEALNRTARIRACGHGGQILVSKPTADLLAGRPPEGFGLLPLGSHRLRDLARPEEVWQLTAPGLPAQFPPLVSLDIERSNLPVALTSLIGRERERAELAAAVTGDCRLVTLTGPGGVGKTRLALQVAADCLDVFPDGVWWVELATLERGGRVAEVVVRSLGLVESAGVAPLEQLIAGLSRWRALLVLDNCEHLLDDAASVVDGLLRGCRDLSVLTTSREPLAAPAETVWPVPALPVADAGAPLATVVEAAAVRLFVERARQARPGFAVDDHNVAAVSEVCRRLDGIPLALELAAARVRSMPIQDIVRDLDDRFQLLTGGARTRLPRHQTLSASLEWSHDLLSDVEQRVFRRLWVFVGRFTATAAVAVAGIDVDRRDCTDALAHLVDKSLVQLDDRSRRYLMLETMRQFAVERARAAAELDAVRDRHTTWIVDFLSGLDLKMLEDPALAAIDADYENIRTALESAITAGSTTQAVTIVDSLAQFWTIAGRFGDAITLADPVLADLHRDPRRWASIVSRLGLARLAAGDIDFITNDNVEALEIARAAGDDATCAHCLYTKALAEGSDSAAYEDAIELASRGGDRRLSVILAGVAPVSMLGTEPGQDLLDRARRLGRGVDISGSRYIPDGYSALHAALRGDLATAGQFARRCLDEPIRSPVIHLPIAIAFIPFARQADDPDLLDLVARRMPNHWRDLPGQKRWFALLDHALAPGDGTTPQVPLKLPQVRMIGLLTSDVLVRALLSEERDEDVVVWAERVPDSWPAAHAAAMLARAWAAYRRNEPCTAAVLRRVLADTARLGLQLYETEALELGAAYLADDQPEAAATLLGAAAAARQHMGLRWRYPYHERAVTIAATRCEEALGPASLAAVRERGVAGGSATGVALATALLADGEATQTL
jgi:predicted ATPase/class 3 adenylate cyclase